MKYNIFIGIGIFLTVFSFSFCSKDIKQGITPDTLIPFRQIELVSKYTQNVWKTYSVRTVDRLPGFNPAKYRSVEQDQYGGWKIAQENATGFFRVQNLNFGDKERWFIIDPNGYPYIDRGIAVFNPGSSEREMSVFSARWGNNTNWARQEADSIRKFGFNSVGSWSNHDALRYINKPPAYCIFLNPMAKLKAYMESHGETWQDVVPVWDPRFDMYLESTLVAARNYKDDKSLIGYFTDNELPWYKTALKSFLTKFTTSDPNYIAVKAWLDARKGKNASLSDVTDSDCLAFAAYNLEIYLTKTRAALFKYDPNHLYLGPKFHRINDVLINRDLIQVAGKYIDILAIDYYPVFEPDSNVMAKWESWAQKPFMIAEFYTKGVDSGLPNTSGVGATVKTQADRGYWYQNYTLKLLSSKGCVGWHWFRYKDNDPTNLKSDPSNVDSNKGILTWDFKYYQPLVSRMKELNDNTLNLLYYLGYEIK